MLRENGAGRAWRIIRKPKSTGMIGIGASHRFLRCLRKFQNSAIELTLPMFQIPVISKR